MRIKTLIQIPRIASAGSLSFTGVLLPILGSRKCSPEPVAPLKQTQRRGKHQPVRHLLRWGRKRCNQVTALQCW